MKNPAFERRHYNAVAQVLRATAPQDLSTPEGMAVSNAWTDIRARFIRLFTHDNPRFSTDRFIVATEPEYWRRPEAAE